ncbi:MAG TPA: IS4 family transposase [Methylomirabilota bacterium]|nr:IS4 family transposase [Methylomirabilota bacterium]
MRRLGGDRAGEIRLTRFLRNAAVTPEAMVAEAGAGTARRCAGLHVLAIQDTTVVRSEGGGGLYLHPTLAVDAASGAILGLTHAEFLSRTRGKKAERRSKPIAEKESRRWLDAAARSAEVCATAARLTMIGDRENDIFQAFALRPAGTDLLVRAAHDRALEDGGRLFAQIDALPVAGRAELDLAAKPGRKARQAQIAVRFATASLARPRNGLREGLPASLAVTVVDVREEAPPAGEAPVHWRLLTTHAVAEAAEAFAIADLYRRRWAIEQLFRTMKTQGFDIEGLLIEEEAPLRRLVMATLIAAVTVQQLVHARDGEAGPNPLRPITDAFEAEDQPLLEAFCAKLEGKTQRQKNPHPQGSLAYAAWVCARLGGWTGYYGKPGPIVMLQGWLYFQAAKHGAALSAAYRDV